MTQIEQAMRRALELAARGPAVGPNPQVGAVLLDAAGTIVAEGWHRGAGTPHAEVDALAKLRAGTHEAELRAGGWDGLPHAGVPDDPQRAGEPEGLLRAGEPEGLPRAGVPEDPQRAGEPERPMPAAGPGTSGTPDARGLTAVVTLEPCNHVGRTGPCSLALIEAGVARVVYAVPDPGAGSAGGAQRLREAGIEVVPGVLRDEAEAFQHRWLTAMRLRRPFVTVKWAASLDGRAAAADGSSQWITGTAARQRVHEQRAGSDAILVGTGTVLADDPSLTARGDAGELLPHQPLPVVVGSRPVPAGAALRGHPAGLLETGTRDLDEVLRRLWDREIRTAYVEGGPVLASAFLAAGLVDELVVYLAPKLLGGPRLAVGDLGIPGIADAHPLVFTGIEVLGDDLMITARPRREAAAEAQPQTNDEEH